MGKNVIGVIGMFASLFGMVATVVGNWADKRETEIMVDEKIENALAEKNKDEEEDKEETEEENK